MNDQPILTRHLKVCFEVEVSALPIAPEILAEKLELSLLQQAFFGNSSLCDKTPAFWGLSEVENHLSEMQSTQSWMTEDPYPVEVYTGREEP